MPNYEALQNTALRLITNFGDTWTHRKTIKGTYDPSTNITSSNIQNDTSVKAVRMDYKSYQIDGEVIRKDDVKLLVESNAFAESPTINDEMIYSSVTWQIVDIKQISPGSITIYYEMQLRK